MQSPFEPSSEPGRDEVQVSLPLRAATGTRAIATTVRRSLELMSGIDTAHSFLKINQPGGFDCPGCAWPEPPPGERKHVELCENGIKAVAEEATSRRADRAFFAKHDLSDLRSRSDFWLGRAGRLTEPMVKRPGATHFEPISWQSAFQQIAETLSSLDSPDEGIFYTSGRTSNEAAWLYQLMVRSFGTNNLPDCSNMCHEPTSAALERSIGLGKGSVRLGDFAEADVVLLVGQNPGTNHPRMLSALEEAKRSGAQIIAINPLPEAGLLRFKNPQRARGIVGNGTKLADVHLPIRLGADQALFQLWSSWMLTRPEGRAGVDNAFIASYTSGFEEFRTYLSTVDTDDLTAATGIDPALLEQAFRIVAGSKRTIICWAMGITQHTNAVATIDELVNFALLGGHIGRTGAGLCPVRGHSNVQGDRTMGVWEQIQPALIDALEQRFQIDLPRAKGFDTVSSVQALADGRASVFVGLGGNFSRATPDSDLVESAFRTVDLVVNVSTKLNRTHLLSDETSIILPTLGRTDRDHHDGHDRFVTVEDSMGKIHASQGMLDPASPSLLSEVEIVCEIAAALLGQDHAVTWREFAANYDAIRDAIGETVHGFVDFNRRVKEPGGFELPHPPRDDRRFDTSDGKAQFTVTTFERSTAPLLLQTMRSHDQYNTTIYGHDDRYRGISGDRHVILLSQTDIVAQGLSDGCRVDIHTDLPGPERVVRNYLVVQYPTPPGCAAAYFPETNALIPLDHRDMRAGTPASKAVPIRIERSQSAT